MNRDDLVVLERLLPGGSAHAQLVRVPLSEPEITDGIRRFIEAFPGDLARARRQELVRPPGIVWEPRGVSILLEHFQIGHISSEQLAAAEWRANRQEALLPLLKKKQTQFVVRWEPDRDGHSIACACLGQWQEADPLGAEQFRARGLGRNVMAYRWTGLWSPDGEAWPLQQLCEWLRAEGESRQAERLIDSEEELRAWLGPPRAGDGQDLPVAPEEVAELLALVAMAHPASVCALRVHKEHAAFVLRNPFVERKHTAVLMLQWSRKPGLARSITTRRRWRLDGVDWVGLAHPLQTPPVGSPLVRSLHALAEVLPPGLRRAGGAAAELFPPGHRAGTLEIDVPASPAEIGDIVGAVLRRLGFGDRRVDADAGIAEATRRERRSDNGEPLLLRLVVRWQDEEARAATARVAWAIAIEYEPNSIGQRTGPSFDAYWSARLGAAFLDEARSTTRRRPARDVSVLMIGPGEKRPDPVRGTVLDYTACADHLKARGFERGTYPIGAWTFGLRGGPIQRGANLFLDDATVARGVVVCAPPGTGKTRLLVRWALAAQARGASVFFVDVKGTLLANHPEIDPGGPSLYHFTTDTSEGVESDRINFLADLRWIAPPSRPDQAYPVTKWDAFARLDAKVSAVAVAIAAQAEPEERGGDEWRYHLNRRRWLCAFIHLLKLEELYRPEVFPGRTADLADLYELLSDEGEFYKRVALLLEKEQSLADDPGLPPLGVSHQLRELGMLIRRDAPGALAGFSQQTLHESFGGLTTQITTALRPFSTQLRGRVRDVGSRGRLFNLEDVFSGATPATVVFAAREQDEESAEVLLAIAVRRLQSLVDARMGKPAATPLVLLLDEAARIHGFDANKYVSFKREANAGCVLVYQDLSYIGDDARALSLLRIVGAQVYLGSLDGKTLELFQAAMPKLRRFRTARATQKGQQGGGVSLQEIDEEVPRLGDAELGSLPAGERPALVVVRRESGDVLPPMLVDLDEAVVPPPVALRRNPPLRVEAEQIDDVQEWLDALLAAPGDGDARRAAWWIWSCAHEPDPGTEEESTAVEALPRSARLRLCAMAALGHESGDVQWSLVDALLELAFSSEAAEPLAREAMSRWCRAPSAGWVSWEKAAAFVVATLGAMRSGVSASEPGDGGPLEPTWLAWGEVIRAMALPSAGDQEKVAAAGWLHLIEHPDAAANSLATIADVVESLPADARQEALRFAERWPARVLGVVERAMACFEGPYTVSAREMATLARLLGERGPIEARALLQKLADGDRGPRLPGREREDLASTASEAIRALDARLAT